MRITVKVPKTHTTTNRKATHIVLHIQNIQKSNISGRPLANWTCPEERNQIHEEYETSSVRASWGENSEHTKRCHQILRGSLEGSDVHLQDPTQEKQMVFAKYLTDIDAPEGRTLQFLSYPASEWAVSQSKKYPTLELPLSSQEFSQVTPLRKSLDYRNCSRLIKESNYGHILAIFSNLCLMKLKVGKRGPNGGGPSKLNIWIFIQEQQRTHYCRAIM